MALMADYIDGVDEWADLKGGYIFYKLNSRGIAFVASGCWSGIKADKEKESQLKQYELELAMEANKIALEADKIALEANKIARRGNIIALVGVGLAVGSLLTSLMLHFFF